MLTAKDVMTEDVITVSPDTDILPATKLLLEKRINGLPVLDASGKLVGILCQSDLIAQQKKLPIPSLFTFLDGMINFTSMKMLEREVRKVTANTVGDVMTPSPVTVRPDTDIETIATLMVERNFHTLPVADDDGGLSGIVGKEDVLRTLMPAQD